MTDDLVALCKAYLADELGPKARMMVEQRMALGDKALLDAMDQLRGFRNPEQKVRSESAIPAIPHTYSTTEIPDEPDASPAKPRFTDRPQVISPFDIAEARADANWIKTAAISLGLLGIALVVYLIYLQWDVYLIKKEKDVLEQKWLMQQEWNKQIQEELKLSKTQLNRVKALLTSELPELTVFKSDIEEMQSAILFWDKSTYRAALMFREATFSVKQAVQVWSYNVKERDWLLVGNFHPVKNDSLYMRFQNDNIARSSGLEMRVTPNFVPNPTRNEGRLVGKVTGIK